MIQMKPASRILVVLVLTCAFPFSLSAQGPAPASPEYEGYPVLKASEVLKPGVLASPVHRVLESIPTQGLANQYTLATPWGNFTVESNYLLAKRIAEFRAIAQLEAVSKSGEFQNALAAAAAKPLEMATSALRDPAGTVKGIGSGAGRFLRKVGEAVDRGGKKSGNTDSAIEGLLGLSKAKRQLAAQVQVDPYSDNPVLQQRLDDVARASFAGGFIVKAGMLAIPGGAGAAIGAVNTSADLTSLLRDNDPLALSALNRDKLISLGVGEAAAKAFVEHPILTPSQQTEITMQLAQLGKVEGNEAFLAMTLETSNAVDAAFFVSTAAMMAVYHEKVSPVTRILNIHGIPAILARNNALVFPLSLDYGSWSPEADRLSQALAAFDPGVRVSRKLLYVSGIISPRARQELEARGFSVSDRANPTTYK